MFTTNPKFLCHLHSCVPNIHSYKILVFFQSSVLHLYSFPIPTLSSIPLFCIASFETGPEYFSAKVIIFNLQKRSVVYMLELTSRGIWWAWLAQSWRNNDRLWFASPWMGKHSTPVIHKRQAAQTAGNDGTKDLDRTTDDLKGDVATPSARLLPAL